MRFTSSETVARSFVLSGEIADVQRRFILKPGLNRIGSLPGSDVRLEAPGVSKCHAVLALRPDHLTVEDLASKNGTFVNGSRVDCTRVKPGDAVRFGTATLRLEETHPSEGELAIAFEDRVSSARIGSLDTSPLPDGWGPALADKGLRLVEGFVGRLCEDTPSRLVSALALLVDELGARGACLLELSPGEAPTVLGCFGETDEDLLTPRRLAPRGGIQLRHVPSPVAGGLPLTLVVGADAGADALALAVWGGSAAGRSGAGPVLRTLLMLCERLVPRRWQPGTGPAAGAGEGKGPVRLELPRDYVRCESAPMVALYRQMAAVAGADVPVLVLGETGVGKEAIARILHRSSGHREGPFVPINCAAIPAELLEAELFGIGRGVATGVTERQGKFEQAEGGTLFLDEVGDMSKDLQAKLLRALQEREIQPVGGSPRPIRVHIVAATNSSLPRRIETGDFRSDLYYRLAGFVLTVAPLRDRKDDVPVLVEHFLRAGAREAGKSIRGITLGALRELVERPWPGNVRQLAHEVLRLVYLCPNGQAIDSSLLSASPPVDPVEALPARRGTAPATPPGSRAQPAEGSSDADRPRDQELNARSLARLRLDEIERQVVREALRRCDDNRTHAARLLGISRDALRRRLARWDRDRAAAAKP